MDGEIGVRAKGVARVVQRPNRGRMNGAVVGRIFEGFGSQMDGGRVRFHQPVEERAVLRRRVVRQEHQRVERALRDGAADGTASGPAAVRAVEIGLADPGEEHRGHASIIRFLFHNRRNIVWWRGGEQPAQTERHVRSVTATPVEPDLQSGLAGRIRLGGTRATHVEGAGACADRRVRAVHRPLF